MIGIQVQMNVNLMPSSSFLCLYARDGFGPTRFNLIYQLISAIYAILESQDTVAPFFHAHFIIKCVRLLYLRGKSRVVKERTNGRGRDRKLSESRKSFFYFIVINKVWLSCFLL